MAWNEPGGNGDKDPWGNRGNQGPPDLDEVFKNFQRKFGSLFGGKGGRGGGRGLLDEEEQHVLLQDGAPTGTQGDFIKTVPIS